ncbi:MAG TPA: IucA/IucC family protein [Micromonosporaceae bacterium]|nr:IucA/IucC family protein [Micromonosporaceae bacterium]
MRLGLPTRLREAATHAEAELTAAAPDLLTAFRDALPRAGDTVSRRLLAALVREGLLGAPRGARRHAFGQVALTGPAVPDPIELLADLPGGNDALAGELADAVVKLAIAYARRPAPDPAGQLDAAQRLDADDQIALLERLGVDGHNLHPCGRTRLGWSVRDVLDHDLESGATAVGFVAVRRGRHVGHDVGALLRDSFPQLPVAASGYALQPVHAWQLAHRIPQRYADLLAAGDLRVLDGATLTAVPTAALRTLLLPPGGDGAARGYLKLSLDIQVTSTRRTISVASTQNGPVLSALLHRLTAGEDRLVLLPETAGAAVCAPGGRSRDLGAIVRTGLAGRLGPGEIAVPGTAMGPLLGTLVARYAVRRRLSMGAPAGLAFLTDYAGILLPPLLRLATRHGIALEAHLQNSIVTFREGLPHRLVLRDFAGLRLHRARLERHSGPAVLWPESVVATDSLDVMRAKLGYTALQAHLADLVQRLVVAHGVDETAAWQAVRDVLDETYEPMLGDPATATRARADHAFFTAPTVPHKALVRMRLANDGGDRYVPVGNPLA